MPYTQSFSNTVITIKTSFKHLEDKIIQLSEQYISVQKKPTNSLEQCHKINLDQKKHINVQKKQKQSVHHFVIFRFTHSLLVTTILTVLFTLKICVAFKLISSLEKCHVAVW